MRISAIVPCRNERRHICAFVDSLFRQRLESGWDLEVLVADGMSDDGTRQILREYAEKNSNLRVIDNSGRIVSIGLNALIAASAGEIIVRMDVHTSYADDYIQQCVHVLLDSGADTVGGPWVARGHDALSEAIAAAFQSPFCGGGAKSRDPHYEGEADTVYLGCWRRIAFDRFGLFDPELVRNQDDEFNFRTKRQGGRILQSPRIRSFYTPRSSLVSLFRQYLQYGFWKVAVIRKHGRAASWRHFVPGLFVISSLVLLLWIAVFAALGRSGLATPAGEILIAELLLYALACLAAAAPFHRTLKLPVLVTVPGVIAIHQIAYGLGFVVGLLTPHRAARPHTPKLFTALTR